MYGVAPTKMHSKEEKTSKPVRTRLHADRLEIKAGPFFHFEHMKSLSHNILIKYVPYKEMPQFFEKFGMGAIDRKHPSLLCSSVAGT